MIGLAHTFEARLQGRAGPSIWQPYFDLGKLLHKQAVWPETSSLVFGLAPYLNLSVYAVLVGLLLQSANTATAQASLQLGNLLTMIFWLALARFLAGLAALDTGTPLAGLGASRALFFHVLTEPALVALAYAFAWRVLAAPNADLASTLATLLMALGLLGVILMECGRLPFDNPETKLELTMIEPASELDYSGLELAVWEWAKALRLTSLVFLFSLVTMRSGHTVEEWWLITQFMLYPLLMLLLAIWELTRPKIRLRQVTGPAAIAFVLTLGAVLFSYLGTVLARYFER
jgi:formate hydrogenlyase subunit 4